MTNQLQFFAEQLSSGSMLIFFNQAEKRFLSIPKNETEDNNIQKCDRVYYYRNRAGFVQIDELNEIELFEYAEIFAENEKNKQLLLVLDSENPLKLFFYAINSKPELKQAWQRMLTQVYVAQLVQLQIE